MAQRVEPIAQVLDGATRDLANNIVQGMARHLRDAIAAPKVLDKMHPRTLVDTMERRWRKITSSTVKDLRDRLYSFRQGSSSFEQFTQSIDALSNELTSADRSLRPEKKLEMLLFRTSDHLWNSVQDLFPRYRALIARLDDPMHWNSENCTAKLHEFKIVNEELQDLYFESCALFDNSKAARKGSAVMTNELALLAEGQV